jgi:hypothetical protein
MTATPNEGDSPVVFPSDLTNTTGTTTSFPPIEWRPVIRRPTLGWLRFQNWPHRRQARSATEQVAEKLSHLGAYGPLYNVWVFATLGRQGDVFTPEEADLLLWLMYYSRRGGRL